MKKLPIPINKGKIEAFCRKYHIAYLALFGSILTPHFNENSDVDFLVEFETGHIPHLFGIVAMESELSDIVGRPADLRTPNDLSPYFRDEVIASAEKLYGK
jgi:hypothetical protein